jgi:type 1 glutamine amidotransferase
VSEKPTKTHLTYVEAAQWLAERGIPVTNWTVRKWGRTGKLKVLDLGHVIKRVAVSDLEKMLKENTR